jgi:hypothetical protein
LRLLSYWSGHNATLKLIPSEVCQSDRQDENMLSKISPDGQKVLAATYLTMVLIDGIIDVVYGTGIIRAVLLMIIVPIFDPNHLRSSYRVSTKFIVLVAFILFLPVCAPIAFAYDYITHQGCFGPEGMAYRHIPESPETTFAVPDSPIGFGVWRSGKHLVLHREARLPDRCIKTNQPAHGKRLKLTLVWHPDINGEVHGFSHLYFMLFKGVFTRKKVKLEFGVSADFLAQRRSLTGTAWTAGIFGLVMLCVPYGAFMPSLADSVSPIVFGVALLLVTIGIICGVQVGGLVRVAYFKHNFVWIEGASPAYLASLPVWETSHYAR